jgi:hypothetical protein
MKCPIERMLSSNIPASAGFGGILQSLRGLERASTRSAFAKMQAWPAFSPRYDQCRIRQPENPINGASMARLF